MSRTVSIRGDASGTWSNRNSPPSASDINVTGTPPTQSPTGGKQRRPRAAPTNRPQTQVLVSSGGIPSGREAAAAPSPATCRFPPTAYELMKMEPNA